MLVLSRQLGERLVIDGRIEVTVVEIRPDRIKLGVVAPPEVAVHREEVFRKILARAASRSQPRRITVPRGIRVVTSRSAVNDLVTDRINARQFY